MKKDFSITETEWKIMEAVWDNPNISFGEIKNSLCDSAWSDSTIKTLIRRLVAKGALNYTEDGGHNRYSASISREKCQLKETKNLIDRVFGGSLKMLVASLTHESSLSEEEAEKLMDIISKMEEDK